MTHHRQFERCSLEAHVTRRVAKHEAKVDVDQVTFPVDQDVTVMPVLNLQEVCDNAVTCKRFDEVSLRASESSRVHLAVRLAEVKDESGGGKSTVGRNSPECSGPTARHAPGRPPPSDAHTHPS